MWWNLKYSIDFPFGFFLYIWVDVIFIKESTKAILVMFDNKKAWFPKAWIVRIKHDKDSNKAKIKISEYYWAKKFE